MRKIAKSKQMKFLDAFHQLCSELGGREGSKDPGYFTFETKGGLVTVHADAGGIYSIFGRFENGEEAAIGFGLNQTRTDSSGHRLAPWTGKWNFRYSDELSAILLSKEAVS